MCRRLDRTVIAALSDVQGRMQDLQSAHGSTVEKIGEKQSQIVQAQRRALRSQQEQLKKHESNMGVIVTSQDRMQMQLRDITAALKELQIGIIQGQHATTTLIFGSATDAAIALSHVFLCIRQIYSICSAAIGVSESLRKNNANWLQLQFNEILADVHSASASELRHSKREKVRQSGQMLPARVAQKQFLQARRQICRKRKASSCHEHMEVSLAYGNAILFFSKDDYEGRINAVRIVFKPSIRPLGGLKGFSAVSIRNAATGRLIGRSISAYGVQPNDSPIFSFIDSGNITGVRQLLSTRQVNPDDRDEDGNSLLLVSLGQSPSLIPLTESRRLL